MQLKTYRPSRFKKLLAWGLIAFALICATGVVAGLALHWNQSTRQDVLAALCIGVFLAFLVACGIGILRTYFRLGADHIEIGRAFGTTRIPISELGGYGILILTVNLVPSTYIRLYRLGPVELAKLLVSSRDLSEVQAWFASRLPLVVDEGSIVRPNPRYRDVEGFERASKR